MRWLIIIAAIGVGASLVRGITYALVTAVDHPSRVVEIRPLR